MARAVSPARRDSLTTSEGSGLLGIRDRIYETTRLYYRYGVAVGLTVRILVAGLGLALAAATQALWMLIMMLWRR